jgi:hypothetical protein
MNDTGAGRDRLPSAEPSDPAMAASDPGMFAALSYDEDIILYEHLESGHAKQSAVYKPLSELWKDTNATLHDLLDARKMTRQAGHDARQAASPAEREPEAGQ